MANPVFDFGRNEKADLNHSTFDLSKKEFFTGRIGQLIPCYKNEVLAGDKVTIQPYLDIQMSPTLKTLKSKFKIVIDYFSVPFQAIWKNYPYFVNQGQNGVGQVPEIPYHSFNKNSEAVFHGSLYDYLGVPTLTSYNTNNVEHFDIAHVGGNSSNRPCGFFFGLHQNRAHSWDADDKTTKSQRVQVYFDHIIEDYKTSPLSGLAGMHTTDSLGQHVAASANPYGQILHSLAFGSQFVTWPYLNGYRNIDSTQYVDANGVTHMVGSRDTEAKKKGLILNPLPENATFRVPGSHIGCLSNDINPVSASSNFSEVLVMFDSYGRPVRYFANNTNTNGVDPFVLDKEWSNNAVSGSWVSSAPLNKLSIDSFYTASYVLSTDTINEINDYLLTANGKKGVTFGFYTFYDVAVDKLNYKTMGVWSLPLGDYYSTMKDNGSYTMDSAKVGSVTLSSSGYGTAGANASTRDLHWYLGFVCDVPVSVKSVHDIAVESTRPYAKDEQGNIAVKLNAFYARAYECIYNYFYRNRVTDPLLDSQNRRVINQFLRDDYMTDGPDGHDYKLRRALLEKDRFTSCISADIINHTPLVGIRHASGDTNAVALVFSVDGEGHEVWVGEEDGQVKITKYSEGLPNGTLNVVKDTIKQGIAWRDVQAVRQLQSWLHKHIECGYNFSDIQLATFGVNTKWNPNTAPKYLGGTAEIVDNGNIVSMAGDNMGERCGNPTAFSTHENTITHFVTDAGVIIGIMRIVPEVVYTQMIDPLFIKHDYFDFYNPSFDNKGYESVTKGQMMPQLAYAEGKLDEVFGYNVPWSSYKFTQNEAHADARTTERDMLFYREFAQCPSLNKSFLECDPDDYDHIFRHISSLDDKFYASIFTKAVYSRPIGNPVDTI